MTQFISDRALPATNGTFVRGACPAILDLNSLVEKIALTNIPVLLMGESGTGKEVYARVIHSLSKQGQHPMRKVSCRGVEQAELFAFKADLKDRREGSDSVGRPQTLFLDGIDELDLDSQKILLSFLPDGETDGDNPSQTRLIASTSRNLENDVESGRFRRELYFRINGVCLRLPPLRDRKEDIQPLMRFFLAKHAAELGREARALSDQEIDLLTTYEWPGNIRELENLARRIVLLSDSRKAVQELGEMPTLERAHQEEARTLSLKAAARTASRKTERDLIAKALEQTHWNRKRAAQQLQISYKSLLYKIKQTGLEEKQKERG